MKKPRLTDADRLAIETGLRSGKTACGIAKELSRPVTTIHAAMVNTPDRFTFSPRTAYRYVDGGPLATKRHNLPRACMARPRRGKGVEHRVDRTCRVGRTWDDDLKFVEGNPGVRVVEMDTVEGARGGKALLTLIFNPFNFMLAFLVDAKTSECVLGVFSAILSALKERYGEDGGREVFSRLFPVILTDNGTEFSNPPGSSSTPTAAGSCPCSTAAFRLKGRRPT